MTNSDRVDTARAALAGQDDGDDQTRLVDLLANLMHFGHSELMSRSFDEALRVARMHFEAEQEEAEQEGEAGE